CRIYDDGLGFCSLAPDLRGRLRKYPSEPVSFGAALLILEGARPLRAPTLGGKMSFLRTRLLRLAALAALSSTLIGCGDAEEGDAGAGGGMTDPEAPASCDILASVTGTYTVTG